MDSKEYARRYWLKHPDKYREYRRRYYMRNRDKVLKKHHEYYQHNKDKCLKQNQEYRKRKGIQDSMLLKCVNMNFQSGTAAFYPCLKMRHITL